jgi:hypothetical protein
MAKTRRILPILLLLAVLATISWLVLRPPDPEPTYQGMPLTWWLDGLVLGSIPPAQANEAVQQIGTNAIPTLLRMLKSRDSSFKFKLNQLAHKQHVIRFRFKWANPQHSEALAGFTALGPRAKSAVPALVEIYNQLPPDVNTTYHSDIAAMLASMGPAAADAIPRFLQDTTDTNSAVRWRALWVLSHVTARPDLAVPALKKSLHDPDENIREIAAYDLGAFGDDAQSAVPQLIIALNDPSQRVSTMAASALKKIDPAGATNAITIANSFKPGKL